MNAAQALLDAREAGVFIHVAGTDLRLVASSAPPTSVLNALSIHKPEILNILRETGDWLVLFDERAGVLEFDGGQPRELAELQAVGGCVLDHAMSGANLYSIAIFIGSLLDHIGRSRSHGTNQKAVSSSR
jgi:hypothetical protein